MLRDEVPKHLRWDSSRFALRMTKKFVILSEAKNLTVADDKILRAITLRMTNDTFSAES